MWNSYASKPLPFQVTGEQNSNFLVRITVSKMWIGIFGTGISLTLRLTPLGFGLRALNAFLSCAMDVSL